MNTPTHLYHDSSPPAAQASSTVGQPAAHFHWPSINITPVERLGRIALGLFVAVAGALLLFSAGSALAVVLELLLIAAGLDLVVTGALGHRPLYHKLGYVAKSLRRVS